MKRNQKIVVLLSLVLLMFFLTGTTSYANGTPEVNTTETADVAADMEDDKGNASERSDHITAEGSTTDTKEVSDEKPETDIAKDDTFETTDKVVDHVDVVEFEEETSNGEVPTPEIPEEKVDPEVPGPEVPEDKTEPETPAPDPPNEETPGTPQPETPEEDIPSVTPDTSEAETPSHSSDSSSKSSGSSGHRSRGDNAHGPGIEIPVTELFEAPVIVPEEPTVPHIDEPLPKTGDTSTGVYVFICFGSLAAIILLICDRGEGHSARDAINKGTVTHSWFTVFNYGYSSEVGRYLVQMSQHFLFRLIRFYRTVRLRI